MELLINTLVDNVHNITEKRRPTERSPWALESKRSPWAFEFALAVFQRVKQQAA